MMRKIVSALVCMMAVSAYSTVIQWDSGGVDGDWNVAENWNPEQIPGATDDVEIDITVDDRQVTVPNEYHANVQNLTLTAGTARGLYISNTGSLTVHGDFEQASGMMQIRISSALVDVKGDFLGTAGTGRLIQGNTAGLTIEGDLTASDAYRFDFNMNSSNLGVKWVVVDGVMTFDETQLALRNFVHNDMEQILLFHNTSDQEVVGSFDVAWGTLFDLGAAEDYELKLVDWDGDGVANDVVLELIPEPATLGLVVLSGVLAFALRRLRNC